MIFDTYDWHENQIDDLIADYDDFRKLFKLPNTANSLERWFTAITRLGESLPQNTKQQLRDYVAERGEETGGNSWDI